MGLIFLFQSLLMWCMYVSVCIDVNTIKKEIKEEKKVSKEKKYTKKERRDLPYIYYVYT